MEGAGDQLERLGGYLERTSGVELVRDMEDFARRRPWIFAGAGLVAGLASSRFLKASSVATQDQCSQAATRAGTRTACRRMAPARLRMSRSLARATARVGERRVGPNEGTELRERPLGEVARDLTQDLSLLVRQEVELAKAEMAQKGRVAAQGSG